MFAHAQADARPHTQRAGRFARYAWFVLAYNLLVILWGAVVRATGSGAGCGEHWPLCQGVVIPHGVQIATLIEFAHRASSGVAVVLVVGLVYFGFRQFPAGHAVRRFAMIALCLTLSEGLIGAGLVLFGWTGNNTSPARFVALAIHLANTFMLLAALALTARVAKIARMPEAGTSGLPEATPSLSEAMASRRGLIYLLALAGTLLLAITGTVAALADTLFPSASLAQGLSRDFSATSSYLVRLRVIHPVLAVIVGALLLAIAVGALSAPKSAESSEGYSALGTAPLQRRRAAGWLLGLVIIQAILGVLNLALLAPVAVQVLHLLVADLVWIALVLLCAEALDPQRIASERLPELHLPLTSVSMGPPASASNRQS